MKLSIDIFEPGNMNSSKSLSEIDWLMSNDFESDISLKVEKQSSEIKELSVLVWNSSLDQIPFDDA